MTASLSAAQSLSIAWRSEGPFLATATDVAIDASRPDTVHLSTVNGGVYRSDDGGQTWRLPGDELTSRDVRWVEADPATANTVWAGERDPGNPSMWRSTDRGATWELVTDSYRGELPDLHPVGRRRKAVSSPAPMVSDGRERTGEPVGIAECKRALGGQLDGPLARRVGLQDNRWRTAVAAVG